jgi:nitrogenase molybdenum-cofactor synthesis protein NifE
MPYICELPPYGFEGTLLWLEKIVAKTTGNTLKFQKAYLESISRQEELKNATQELRQLWEAVCFDKAVIVAPPSVAFGMAAALECDFADCGKIEIACQNQLIENPDYKSSKISVLKENSELEQALQAMRPGDLLLGSSQEKKRLRQLNKTQIIWQNISLPVYDEVILRGRPLMGLNGATYIAETLWNQFMDIRFR